MIMKRIGVIAIILMLLPAKMLTNTGCLGSATFLPSMVLAER